MPTCYCIEFIEIYAFIHTHTHTHTRKDMKLTTHDFSPESHYTIF